MATTVTTTSVVSQTYSAPAITETCSDVLQFVSDTHVGAISQYKLDAITNDTPIIPDALVHVGDITNNSGGTEDTDAIAWLDGFAADWYAICGNHDIVERTPAEWAIDYGMAGQDYVVDLDHCRLICMGVNTLSGHIMGTAELDFLDESLDEAGNTPCIIVTHQPYYSTVINTDLVHYYSSDQNYLYVRYTDKILSVLEHYNNAKAMISGHVHCPYFSTGFYCTRKIGDYHEMAFIHASSPYYTDKILLEEPTEPIVTVYLTISSTGLMQRVRDHYNGVWLDTNILTF